MTRQHVAAFDDLVDGEPLRVDVSEVPVALVRLGDEVHAVSDICSHQRVSLSEGEVLVEERAIECWKHGSAFSLDTGEPSQLPATKPIPVFPCGIDADGVWVDVPEDAPR